MPDLLVFFLASSVAVSAHSNCEEVLGEVDQLISEHFFDAELDMKDFVAQTSDPRAVACDADNEGELARAVNEILATLGVSHTAYFSPHSPKRFQMLGIFHATAFQELDDSEFIYDGVGIDTDGSTITEVFDGFPAALAGLRYGDRIESVGGRPFDPTASFQGRAGEQVSLRISRGNLAMDIPVLVDKIDARTMFESAMTDSMRIIQSGKMRIGYVHVWSYAGYRYQEMLKNALLWGDLASADALVLDLRDGYGGASPDYVNLFREPVATMVGIRRDGSRQEYSGVWGKPVNVLTNSGSTSGKELFAYAFKKLGLGKLVGETTAGAVVAGRIFLLKNGAVLYLAVQDVTVDGVRLEGVGVQPDIAVSRSNDDNEGDAQLAAAVADLTARLRR